MSTVDRGLRYCMIGEKHMNAPERNRPFDRHETGMETDVLRGWVGREFVKMNGSGNDFIIIDNRDGAITGPRVPHLASMLCRRKFSIGADGLFLIEPSDTVDFRWRFYNSDGSEAEMCGNGGRCVARFAHSRGIAGDEMKFETAAGIIRATILGPRRVKLQMVPPSGLTLDEKLPLGGTTLTVSAVNTGVPHVIAFVNDLDSCPVVETGRAVRYHPSYKPAGTNADFVRVLSDHTLEVRTYERGVEDETLACGTGVVASVLIAAARGMVTSPVEAVTRGGETLLVHFSRSENGFDSIFLEGDTSLVYQGYVHAEAFSS